MTDAWDAEVYSQFLDARTRPARDLLAAIPTSFQPKMVYDLGCGTGNSTILLKERWPHAEVIGLDSSPAMLKQARTFYPTLTFIQEDITKFSPAQKIDCLFANASLQWLNEHELLLPTLLQYLTSDGVFGFQMPNNFHAPSHQVTIQLLQENLAWQHLLPVLRYGILTTPLYQLPWYYDLLSKAGINYIQLWETEYFQEMPDHKAILDWVKGTALHSVFAAMSAEHQTQFSSAYIKTIAHEYPLQHNNKVLLPFRRIFMVGFKS